MPKVVKKTDTREDESPIRQYGRLGVKAVTRIELGYNSHPVL